MSKIARIRIINLNYNHDSIRIGDEIFDFAGENTLISLRNGGGKSVLVQMIISLFVNHSYRDFGDRKFKSYFTTNRPTFIMTEWQLDDSEERFLAGMMVRKNQAEEDDNDALEICTFTGSYDKACKYDLDHLPVVKSDGKKKTLKGFAECKKILEEISREEGDFRIYDMSGNYGRSQYYHTLKAFQINHKEWESIIRKVNQKESGLSELFRNSKDERNLVENWFLKPIEDKLNQEKNKIEEFRKISFQFIGQYRSNQSRIERKAVIEKYFEDTGKLKIEIDAYADKQTEKDEVTAKMVLSIAKMKETIEHIREIIEKKETEVSAVRDAIKRIDYEEISYHIYEYIEKKNEVSLDRSKQEVQITALTKRKKDYDRKLELYDCHSLYEELVEFWAERTEIEEKIERQLKKSEESRTEIEILGYWLWRYYEYARKYKADICEKKEELYQEKCRTEKQWKEEKEELLHAINESNKEIGKYENAILEYDKTERDFVRDYQIEMKRNLEGWYPDGLLEVRKKELEEQKQEEKTRQTRLFNEKKLMEEKTKNIEQEEEEIRIREVEVKHKLEGCKEELAKLNEEKEYRKKILRYMDLDESDLDHKERILDAIHHRIRNLDMEKTHLQSKKAELEKECIKWREGKIVELPESVLEYFHQNGIEFLYGMEWLTKNGRTAQENADLVKHNPFIPYAIIMEKNIFERLQELEEGRYTSFPIPIILRNELEYHEKSETNHILHYDNIHFFLMFNEHLLNQTELDRMLEKLSSEIKALEKKIEDKEKDISIYHDDSYAIKNQSYRVALYEQKELELKKEKENLALLDNRRKERREEKEKQKQKAKKNLEQIEENKKILFFYETREKEFHVLCEKYKKYEQDSRSLQREKTALKEYEQKKRTYENEIENIGNELIVLKEEIKEYEVRMAEDKKQETIYQMHAKIEHDMEALTDTAEFIAETKDRKLAKYHALTKNISETIEELKERREKLTEKIDRKSAELNRKNKNNLPEEEYKDIFYTQEEYTFVQEEINHLERELNRVYEAVNRLSGEIESLQKDIDYGKKDLFEKIGESEPLEKKEIVDCEFEKRRNLKIHEEKSLIHTIKSNECKKNELQTLLGAIAEFEEEKINVEEEIVNELKKEIPDFETTEKYALDEYQKALRKKLQKTEREKTACRARISDELMGLMAKEEYAEDYFRKTFESLKQQMDVPKLLQEQYQINCTSYENQLEKLRIDLENIDKEQKNIEEMFLEYIRNINANLAMIDRNSTIKVRDRNIKMLRIQVPDWDSEKEHFKLKLHDFMEEMIRHGLQNIQDNKNLNEFLGKVISTKKLYDDVVGIHHVKIKMYKIEEEREIPISWTEVSANSGGEGFLSAFVILTCLLSYMRRDENDLFASGEEGKVLIMDNPFAQTYSAHLLKPLIEMAKKTNTQLICLSGIGGDSVYNRFDNIYVLKLIPSGIQKGTWRMETNHIKGDDTREMNLSDFKTEKN